MMHSQFATEVRHGLRVTVTNLRSNSGKPLVRGLMSLALTTAILATGWPATACAQAKTAKKPKTATKKAKGADQEDAPANALEELDFGAVPVTLRDGETPDELDATPEGRQRLAALEGRAKEIFKDRDGIERELRPLVLPRDRLVGEVTLLNQGILTAQQAIQQGQNQQRKLQQQLSSGKNTDGLIDQIRNLENQIVLANQAIASNREDIAERAPEITSLNSQIQPLEQRLSKLWVELNDFRKQWLEIRQPQFKYAHGSFESLKKVIDDWLLIDSLWPDALCWAALTHYELGQYEAAWDFVDRAAELRKTLRFPKAWAQGEALRGLIAAHLPDRKGKAAGHLQSAQVYVNKDKNTNWEVYFLVGRAVVENDKQAPKARTNFDKALKINPNAACVKYWYGRLQSTTATPAVRDVAAGTKTLEELWEKSTKQSWRLAHGLVLAYDAANRQADADRLWDEVLKLAPKEEHDRLQATRDTAAKQRDSAATSEDASQVKPAKPTTKSKAK